jgi:hypothetical protein
MSGRAFPRSAQPVVTAATNTNGQNRNRRMLPSIVEGENGGESGARVALPRDIGQNLTLSRKGRKS